MSFSDLRFPRCFTISVSAWKTTESDVFISRNCKTLLILYYNRDQSFTSLMADLILHLAGGVLMEHFLEGIALLKHW